MKQGEDEQQDDKERKEAAKEEGNEDEAVKDKGDECAAYEFSVTETTILEVVMDSMRTCGLAIGLLALSSLMLGKPAHSTGNGPAFVYCFLLISHAKRSASTCSQTLTEV